MITWVRLGQLGVSAICPVEFARIDDGPADACAVAADKLRAAMNYNVDAIFNGPKKDGRCNGIVANYRHIIFMGDVGYLLILQNIVFGIAHAFYINQPGIILDCPGEILRVFGVNESYFNAQLSEGLTKQGNRSSIK